MLLKNFSFFQYKEYKKIGKKNCKTCVLELVEENEHENQECLLGYYWMKRWGFSGRNIGRSGETKKFMVIVKIFIKDIAHFV
jgi:hypothetical protein